MREKFWLFLYAFKNALIGMKRHWVLCVSAVTTVFLTLLLAAVLFVTVIHVDRFSDQIGSDLNIHVILDEEITDPAEIQTIQNQIEQTENVVRADYSDRDTELEDMIARKGEAFASYRGEENPLSDAFFVYVEDETQLEKTSSTLLQIDGVSSAVYGGTSVSQLAEILQTARMAAAVFTGLLLILCLYLIYNAIRSSIYSRQDEIAVERTVGASTGFIRTPFEIEGTLIGLLGALVPWLLIVWGYPALYESLRGQLFMPQLALVKPEQMVSLMGWILFGTGALTGWAASCIAAQRYIKRVR